MMATKLPKTVTKKKKRRGQGFGSGRGGHTVGRGMKGQKSRSSVGVRFEGVKVKKSLLKRLPLRRGKGKFKAKGKPIVINLGPLNILPEGTKVNVDTLVKYGVVDRIDAQRFGIKILGDGDIKKKLIVEVPISKGASKKIERAKGKVLIQSVKEKVEKSDTEKKKLVKKKKK